MIAREPLAAWSLDLNSGYILSLGIAVGSAEECGGRYFGFVAGLQVYGPSGSLDATMIAVEDELKAGLKNALAVLEERHDR